MRGLFLLMALCLLVALTAFAGQTKEEKFKKFNQTLGQEIQKDSQVDTLRHWKGGGRSPASVGTIEPEGSPQTKTRQKEGEKLLEEQRKHINNKVGHEPL